jgi:nitroimidazol reductase NimA-like FMN-containing flavoprotein (pyridoxamine 5'-phosphate oxidase superfamily)
LSEFREVAVSGVDVLGTVRGVPSSPPSSRATVRYKGRGHYDREVVHGILDEAVLCHVGVVQDDGTPLVLPTLFARDGDAIYIHGSPASRLLRGGKKGVDVCVTVMLLDGFVMAKSAFHHSVNYRSVVVFGTATEVSDDTEKARVLDLFVEHVHPGRSAECRAANEKELRATLVLRLPLDEASAKVREGGPIDDDEDLDLPYPAGVIPVRSVRGDLVRV